VLEDDHEAVLLLSDETIDGFAREVSGITCRVQHINSKARYRENIHLPSALPSPGVESMIGPPRPGTRTGGQRRPNQAL